MPTGQKRALIIVTLLVTNFTVFAAKQAQSVTTTTSSPTTIAPTTIAPTTITNSSLDRPLDQPNVTDADLIIWATDAASSAYSYDFKNYAKQLQNNQHSFTPAGWTAFMAALNKSNNLQVVQSKKLVASATPTGKAIILTKGVKDGIYSWKLQIPMLATYESESRIIKQNLMVTLLIDRTKIGNGLGISHFVATVLPANQPPVASTIPTSTTTVISPVTTPAGSVTGTITSPTPTTGVTPGVTVPMSTTTAPGATVPMNTTTTPGATVPMSTTTTPGATVPMNTTTTPGATVPMSTTTTPGATAPATTQAGSKTTTGM